MFEWFLSRNLYAKAPRTKPKIRNLNSWLLQRNTCLFVCRLLSFSHLLQLIIVKYTRPAIHVPSQVPSIIYGLAYIQGARQFILGKGLVLLLLLQRISITTTTATAAVTAARATATSAAATTTMSDYGFTMISMVFALQSVRAQGPPILRALGPKYHSEHRSWALQPHYLSPRTLRE